MHRKHRTILISDKGECIKLLLHRLVVCAMNSGCFATERGTSSTYSAMLTKNDAIEASQMELVSHSDARRMVGGGF